MKNDIFKDNLMNSQIFNDMIDKKEIIGEYPILVEKSLFSESFNFVKTYKFKFENENNNNIINQSNSDNNFSQIANLLQNSNANSNSHLNISNYSNELNLKNEEPAKLYFGKNLLILYNIDKKVIILAKYKGIHDKSNLHLMKVKKEYNFERVDINIINKRLEKIKNFCINEYNPKKKDKINVSNNNISAINKPNIINLNEINNNINQNDQKDELKNNNQNNINNTYIIEKINNIFINNNNIKKRKTNINENKNIPNKIIPLNNEQNIFGNVKINNMEYFENNTCINSNKIVDINTTENYQNVLKKETNENHSKTNNKNNEEILSQENIENNNINKIAEDLNDIINKLKKLKLKSKNIEILMPQKIDYEILGVNIFTPIIIAMDKWKKKYFIYFSSLILIPLLSILLLLFYKLLYKLLSII